MNSRSKTQKFLDSQPTSAEIKLLEQISQYQPQVLAKSLQFVHDMALYHTDLPIQMTDKNMLYNVIELSRALREFEDG